MDLSPGRDGLQEQINTAVWRRPNLVQRYAGRRLRPVEVTLLVRYREALSHRVLELGCAAGRLSGYLIELADSLHGVDVSPAMVAYCTETYPAGTFSQTDLCDFTAFETGCYEAAVAPYNALDLLGDTRRRHALEEIARVLTPDGLFIMSSHNRAYAPFVGGPAQILPVRSPVHLAGKLALMPWRARNRGRLRRLERYESDYAIINDEAHDFRMLHYYISRDAQERQLSEAGFDLVECLDGDGRPVARGETAPRHPELSYVARRSADSVGSVAR